MEAVALKPLFNLKELEAGLNGNGRVANGMTGWDILSVDQFDREKLGSTGLVYGVAIPHGRLKNLKDTLCAFVRTQAPVPFESPDGQPVRLVLAMVVPEHATEQHLELLSDLAQMFSDPGLRDQLLAAGDVDAAHRLLTQWSPYAPPQRTAAL